MKFFFIKIYILVSYTVFPWSFSYSDFSSNTEISLLGEFFETNNQFKFSEEHGFIFESELLWQLDSENISLNVKPYLLKKNHHYENFEFDFRELNLNYSNGNWDGTIGINREFWGVTESNRLVDIINQTDYISDYGGNKKLGQPMLKISHIFDKNIIDFFILTGFRERKFLPSSHPLAYPYNIDYQNSLYAASNGINHIDLSARISGFYGPIDYGLSWFSGTSRDPEFIGPRDSQYIPRYPLISQIGLDFQLTLETWLLKLETIFRKHDNKSITKDFFASAIGAEYSIFNLLNGLTDISLISEINYDNRKERNLIPLQNDVFIGFRMSFNDISSSEISGGSFYDLDDGSRTYKIMASRRFLEDSRINLEIQRFGSSNPDNALFYLSDTEFIILSIKYFF